MAGVWLRARIRTRTKALDVTTPEGELTRGHQIGDARFLISRRSRTRLYATMQLPAPLPKVPPPVVTPLLPLAPMGVDSEGASSVSETLEAVEKSVTKRSIDAY